jgi:HAD superfamily hydrolase (TIGR01509 family)
MYTSAPIAALFDVEGTLVDTVALQLESWRETLNEAGYSFTHLDLQPFSGMDGQWMLDQLLPEEPLDIKEYLLKTQGESYRRDFLPRAQPFPEVRLLFEALKQRDVLIGIATTCQKEQLAAYDRRLDILELTDVVACGEMVKHGKPDPALFQTCLTRLQIADPFLTVAVGDTPYDAQAARKLGMRAAGVLTGGFPPELLREAGCGDLFKQVKDVGALWRDTPVRLIRSTR